MKKFLSLLLAALMCLTALTPALAESGLGSLSDLFSGLTTATEQEEAFPYTLDQYKTYFDVMATNMLQVTPVWTTVDGNQVATLAGYGAVVVEMNAQGQIVRLTSEMSFTMDTLSNASNFGMLVALTAISSKAAEDVNFFTSSDVSAYSNELVAVLYDLMGRMSEAVNAPISSTAEVYGDTVTFTCSLSVATMTVTFGFAYEP